MINLISSMLTCHYYNIIFPHGGLFGILYTWPAEAVSPSSGRARWLSFQGPLFVWNQEFPSLFDSQGSVSNFRRENSIQSLFFPNPVKAGGVVWCIARLRCYTQDISMSLEIFHTTGLYTPTFLQFTVKCYDTWLCSSCALISCSKELESRLVDSLLDYRSFLRADLFWTFV